MSRVPIVTGLGLVTPLAVGVDATWNALLGGRFITSHTRTPLDADSPTRVNRIAIAAANEAISQAGWTAPTSDAEPTPLIVGTSKGAIASWLTAPSLDCARGRPENSFLASVGLAVRASIPLLDGPALTLSAACASGLHALIRAAMMVQSGQADRVLVVGAEASVHPLFLASFKRLGVLPKEGVGCRPFDRDRDGFLMSEAAAAICLEAAENRTSHRAYARIDRFALGSDATHMTGSDPAGETFRRMLRHVVNARPVDLIHAHGTATILHDPIELSALDDECTVDESLPIIYSHKGSLGHSLGAAGLVSVVLNCLMHANGTVPPNVQTSHPLTTKRLRISQDTMREPIRRSLATAAGFGGPMAVISLVSA